MNKKDFRIVFMGTPEFAVETLRQLVENDYNVVGVITMPDKPAGRGHKLQYSAVKEYALSQNLPLLQPERLKDSQFIEDLKSWKADLQIVVAFRMLPEMVWNMPAHGTINLHASLLPDYRGAAPINWAIINGDTHTGASTFFLTHEIDTGAVIDQFEIPIRPEDNCGSIHDKLMIRGAQLVLSTVDKVIENNVQPIPQSQMQQRNERPAPKIFKEDCRLDPDKTALELHNQVRGLSPYPAAWFEVGSEENDAFKTTIKVYQTTVVPADLSQQYTIGHLFIEKKKIMLVTSDGLLQLDSLQVAGKKRMNAIELINGFSLPADAKVVNA